jgi:hypothetical protein
MGVRVVHVPVALEQARTVRSYPIHELPPNTMIFPSEAAATRP